jgi:hypothetical protein
VARSSRNCIARALISLVSGAYAALGQQLPYLNIEPNCWSSSNSCRTRDVDLNKPPITSMPASTIPCLASVGDLRG